jgi:hypothetical protein
MNDCNFSIEFRQSPGEVRRLAESAIVRAGGDFSGDERSGQFRLSTGIGSVKGNYSINGNLLSVTISDKPMFVGCGRIENEIKKYLEG